MVYLYPQLPTEEYLGASAGGCRAFRTPYTGDTDNNDGSRFSVCSRQNYRIRKRSLWTLDPEDAQRREVDRTRGNLCDTRAAIIDLSLRRIGGFCFVFVSSICQSLCIWRCVEQLRLAMVEGSLG